MGRKLKVGDFVQVIGEGSQVHRITKVEAAAVVVDPEEGGLAFWENNDKVVPLSDSELRKHSKEMRKQAAFCQKRADDIDKVLAEKAQAMRGEFRVGDWVTVYGDGGAAWHVVGVDTTGVRLSGGEYKGINSLRRLSDTELREMSERARANAVAEVAFADELDAYLAGKR